MKNTETHIIDAVRDADSLVDILASGGVFPLVVTGSSMLPFLKEGRDTVILQKADKLCRGQIVFFRRNSGEFILHRVRRKYPNGRLLVNGDAQSWCELIRSECVLAEVISIERRGRTIDPNGFTSRLLRMLWYPTRPVRPLIFRLYTLSKKVFTRH
ncbi:MAG: S24/S26 family peptidase [Clostridia bacterium]|nr:S24/S26 family peptidase [Clostridia bacterium]